MDNKNEKKATITICPWCGSMVNLIWVHGHGQCSNCGTNIDECCRGENCNLLEDKSTDQNYNNQFPHKV